MRLNVVIARSSRLARRRVAPAAIAARIELIERAAGRGDEREGEYRVHHRGNASKDHTGAERECEAEVLAIAFADGRRVRGEEVGHGRKLYFAAISAIVASSIRLEKPHSL
jgi:hypothetical protein